ncbi:polysaccharide deacetylase family protein [uncultured Sphingomonas sp.]|uniref:polysaccharide deacetylase family protein n=1 Tax=uncultured Sphingomonas sp. TaxID=158754 RepID=UPI0035CAB415
MSRAVRLLVASLALIAAPAQSRSVAVTVDDLPLFGAYAPPAEAERITSDLLRGFRRNHWRVTGFVNEGQLEGPDREERIGLLQRWLDAGEDLGNHTYSHLSLTSTPVDDYIADVVRGESVTKVLLARRGRRERWFRHPYLETGPTLAIRDRFERWLKDHGYRVAPASMENSDWQFADAYDAAVAMGDATTALRVRATYLDFTRRTVAWYRSAGRGLLGREPAFVLLLHASRLNAASVDELAAILRANRLKVVPLDRAMKDAAYTIPDRYAGPDGDEWLIRWANTLHHDLPYDTLPQVPAAIARSAPDAR